MRYEGVPVGLYRLDLVVSSKVVVEIKTVEAIESVRLSVTLAYLKATSLRVGLVINFSGSVMRSRRVFRDVHGVKEEMNLGRSERQFLVAGQTSDEHHAVSSCPVIGHKDVAYDDKDSVQDPQLV